MLLTTTAPAASTTRAAIRPGDVLGHAKVWMVERDGERAKLSRPMQVTAGNVLAAGITDIRAAATDLIGDHWGQGERRTTGLVAFIRNGDAFDAVEMLAPSKPDGSGVHQVWAPWNLEGFRTETGVDIAAVWQVSGYGFDANYGQPGSMFPGA